MNETIVAEKTISLGLAQDIIFNSVDIPSIPGNIRKIFDMTRLPESRVNIPELAELVESDPGLFSRLLLLANSPLYKAMTRISTPKAAIVRIGIQETINSVCLHFLKKMLPQFPDFQGFSYTDYWSFSWACAVANRRLGHPNLGLDVLPGDLYMAGILSGMGKLLLAIHVPHEFARCIETARRLKCPLYQAEKEILGTTDGLVASQVLKGWHLPPAICEAVAYSQEPERAEPGYRLMAGLTQFADCIARLSGVGASGDDCPQDLSRTFLAQKRQLPLAEPKIQAALVKEICQSLEERMTMTPKSHTPVTSNTLSPRKGGLLSWILAFFAQLKK